MGRWNLPNGKSIIIISLIVLLIAVSAVSAADNETGEALTVEESVDDVFTEEDVISSNDTKTFSDLYSKIQNQSEVQLDCNYKFSQDSDTRFKYGVAIYKSITIDGNGFTIDGNHQRRIFSLSNQSSTVTFKNIVFINAFSSSDGGAIYCADYRIKCTAINCTFENNTAGWGGAMYRGTAINCTFRNNHASTGGAGAYMYATNCTFTGNYAEDKGGALYGAGSLNVRNCLFENNRAEYQGGAIFAKVFNAWNCIFINNMANEEGGATHGGKARNCTFKLNNAWQGGASFETNVTDCQFIMNFADDGGACYKGNVHECRFINNSANLNGGATYQTIVYDSNFTNNTAEECGGAVHEGLIMHCLFEYNRARIGGAMNGIKVVNSTFNYNVATDKGGGLYYAKASTDCRFLNNSAGVGNDTFDVDFYDRNSVKSFTELNSLINDNTCSTVYLNDDYLFDFTTDMGLVNGIVIDRELTIIGNGNVLDGERISRIFLVKSANVVFINITFFNGNSFTQNGGAIRGNHTSINCTFKKNQANAGGAFDFGTAINCTFISNSASLCGGAINKGYYIFNCTFISNSVPWGRGGAINEGYAVNCTFMDNIARYGGAMQGDDSYAVNCSFIRNSAGDWGGAMHRGTAVNCNFKDNHAEYDGGAMMDGNAEGCTFANNSAGSNGGAMNGGTFWNCTFVNNSAGEDGDDTYNAIVFKPVLNASNFTSAYDSRDKLQITLTTLAGVQITDANVTIRVYKDNTLIGTFTCPVMDGWIVNLGAGSYIAVLSVENQGYEVDSINVTLTIAKINTKITSSNVKKTYNVSKKLVFILKDSYGKLLSNCKVSIVINGNTYNRNTDSKGKISFTLPNLVPKTYAVKLTFAGNQNLKASNAKVNVVVKKAVPKLTAKAKKFKAKKKTKKYTIKLKTNKNKALKKVKVTLKIKGKTYKKKTNSKGKAVFKIKKLTKKGKYKAVVKFKGNKCYKKVTKKVKITVK